jgi:carboxymethylenebutenolidase
MNEMKSPLIPEEDSRLIIENIKYVSETGDILAYFVRPKGDEKLPGVVVVSEIWGLNSHIKDVARRIALEGFQTIAPDALSPLGGTPEDDDEAVSMIRKLDSQENTKNYVAAVEYLKTHPQSTGKVGITGFCWGGGVSNQVAVNSPDLKAAAPFYGRQPASEDVPKIKSSLLLHYAGLDEWVNPGIPAFETALKKSSIEYEIFIYEGAKHGFFNDTRDVYHDEAAKLAWKRTIDFFKQKLKN